MRRSLTAILAAGLLILPAAPGWAQDPESDPGTGTTETNDNTELTEPAEATDAGSLLAEWAAQLAGILDSFRLEEPPLDEEALATWSELFDALLDTLEVEFMVAQAMEDAAAGDAEGEDVENVEDESAESLEDDDSETDEVHGEVVRTVAQCAPRGREGRDFLDGAKNHGAWVSAVARGDELSLTVPTIENGAVVEGSTTLVMTVETVEDADALCTALATIAEATALQAELDDAAETGDEAETDAVTTTTDSGSDEDERPGRGNAKGKPEHAATGRPAHAGPKGGDRGADADEDEDSADEEDSLDEETVDEETVDDDTVDEEPTDQPTTSNS